jgi:hypothetical protein
LFLPLPPPTPSFTAFPQGAAMNSDNRSMCCPGCGEVVENTNRYAMRNHIRNCVAEGGYDSEEDIMNAMDVDVERMDAEEFNASGIGEAGVAPVAATDFSNFEHLNQFMDTGRCDPTCSQMQLIRFMHMAHSGYGVSRSFSVSMLKYCKDAGGQNVFLPDSWGRCVQETTELIEKLEGKRKTFTLDVAIPEDVRELLADPSQTHIGFEFECPITEMIRVAMFSKTCKSWENVALSYESNDGYLDDFCNGDRYKRIAADLSPGGAILGAILATDGICLDKCMFDSQEVCP